MNIGALEAFEYISFDIFDTLVTRTYMKPVDLFRDLEATLMAEHENLAGFAQARITAELEARGTGNFQKEVTLDQIYSVLGRTLNLPDTQLESIKKRELTLEQVCIAVNNDAKRLLEHLRTRGKRILFLSDIYLPHDFMLQLLRERDLMQGGDLVYISSRIGKMKATGALYEHVLAENAIDPRKMCHIGDNTESDVRLPRKYGITSFHYDKVHASRYEAPPERDLFLSKLTAMSKLTRLSGCYPEGSGNKVIWNVTADVSAPMIFAFVNWTVQEARRQGIRSLYFLSRDGQIMYRIADLIIRRFYANELDARYLHVSRQSLLFPATTELNKEAYEWIMAPTSLRTPRIILRRINFLPEEAYHLLKKYGLHEMIDTHLDAEGVRRFRKLLPELWPALIARIGRYKANTIGYFHQEGLFRPGKLAVVDIGWSGTLQRSISRLMAMEGDNKPLAGFYFGLKNRKKHKESDCLYAWFTDYTAPRALDRETYIIPMTELFTAADHGGVVCHEYTDGRFVPVLKERINATGASWGVQVQQDAMLEYTKAVLSLGRGVVEDNRASDIDFFEENYRRFLLSPTYEEADTYGMYMIAEDQNESYHVPLARGYSCLELLKLAITGRGRHHNEWQQGAIGLTECFLKGALKRMA